MSKKMLAVFLLHLNIIITKNTDRQWQAHEWLDFQRCNYEKHAELFCGDKTLSQSLEYEATFNKINYNTGIPWFR